MPELPVITIRYNGLFDFDGFYSAVIDWAKNYGFLWREMSYKHKVPAPTGAEQEWEWEITKKVTEYINYYILIEIHSWDMVEVEVEEGGKKKSLMSGRLNVVIKPELKMGTKDIFKGGKFAELLGSWYNKAISRNIDTYWDQLYYRTWNLHAVMKKYFDMQSKKHVYKGYLGEG
ncbi:hypothetical protein HYX14_00650 [Candidatus Woesearchaeota archaeon]|nr:hypothetical protein [Candidatus Woesearchaeota archaeon]